MSGLFEDDESIRRKPLLPQKVKPQKKKEEDIGSMILAKMKNTNDIINIKAKGSGKINLVDLDLAALQQNKKTESKVDNEKIVPLINYLSD